MSGPRATAIGRASLTANLTFDPVSAGRIARGLTTPPLALIVALFAGCATVPQTPIVAGVKTEVVSIPVNVRCVRLSELPAIPKTRLDPEKQTIEQMIIAMQLDFNNLEDYVVRADALLRACATEPQPSTDKPK